VSTSSDKPTKRKATAATKTRKAVKVDPATQRSANADESAPETLVPDVVRTHLTQSPIASDTDRDRWIAERAYSLAQARGFAPGGELDDWLQAEREYDTRQGEQLRPENQFTG